MVIGGLVACALCSGQIKNLAKSMEKDDKKKKGKKGGKGSKKKGSSKKRKGKK